MNLSLLTLFPELYDSFASTSIIGKAVERGDLKIDISNLCDQVAPKKRIDAPPFGPGAGMLIKPDIISGAIEEHQNKHGEAFKIFFSPHGKKLNQDLIKKITPKILEKKHLLLVAPRYEGVDVRAEEIYADEIISVGDFVLMGGDIPALTFLEAFLRFVPGVVGNNESVELDSFMGPFMDFPHYTKPLIFKGLEVPPVLRSGNHSEIEKWRLDQSVKRTVKNNFEWLRGSHLDKKDIDLVKKNIPNHYSALIHHDVKLVDDTFGNSSVTSIDIHDIARSSSTYGIKKYFITTPLADQKKMIQTFLDFWRSDVGIDYNSDRHSALSIVQTADYLNDVIEKVYQIEGKEPLVIATSACDELGMDRSKIITYRDQGKIWSLDRPIIFIFGTAGGLSVNILKQCDFLLLPVNGLSNFNHLSVRSAAAIIFDRWLGLNPRSS